MKKASLLIVLFAFLHLNARAQVSPPYWNDIVAFKKSDAAHFPAPGQILFIGSSSFTKWKDVNDYFPGFKIINRGFGGSSLPDLTRYFYDILFPYQPKQVIIYCGENDLATADSVSAVTVVQRFKTLYGMIRENFPGIPIGFVSIKPSPVRAGIQTKVREANKDIKEFLKNKENASFIDIYGAMLSNSGQMREELYVEDRLHMRPEGYAIWQKIIQPYLIK